MEANCCIILYRFCQTSTWICHGCTCVPHPEPLSLLPLSGLCGRGNLLNLQKYSRFWLGAEVRQAHAVVKCKTWIRNLKTTILLYENLLYESYIIIHLQKRWFRLRLTIYYISSIICDCHMILTLLVVNSQANVEYVV